MSDTNDTRPDQAGTFLQRWARRKQDVALQKQADTEPVPEPATTSPAITDSRTELPDPETLDENSEVSMYLAEHVSETIKRKALRKLFHMDKFNICDGLDDYAEDYTNFQPLGNVITAHQRLREERESLAKLAEAEEQTRQASTQTGNDSLSQPGNDSVAMQNEEEDADVLPAEPADKNMGESS